MARTPYIRSPSFVIKITTYVWALRRTSTIGPILNWFPKWDT